MMSALRRRLARPQLVRRRGAGVYRDPFFADPGVVEDDRRRMNGHRNQPSFTPQLIPGWTTPKA
jgi:hypothetical protein